MIISEKKLENAKIELQIEVPQDRVDLEYKNVFKNIQLNAKMDGFRKGKAPMDMVERRFLDLANQEVAENLLRSVYVDVMTEKDFKPVSQPSFDFENISRNKPFAFKATFEVFPTIELANYKGLSVQERDCKITDADIDKEIEGMRERNATISKKESGSAVENGNLVKMKLKRIDNVEESEIEKLEYKDYTIIVGKSKDEYTFDKDLLGMKAEEEKEVKIKYPKDYSVKELAGQSVTYKIKTDEISTMDLPALDDDFAKDLGTYESLNDLKSSIRKDIEKYVSDISTAESKRKLIAEIIQNSKFDIPMSMIEKEVQAIFGRVQERTGYFSQDINEFAAVAGMDAENFSEKLKEEAIQNIKSTLILTEIVKKEELKVKEEKYKEIIETISARNNKSIAEIEKIIEENNSRENIESELLLESARDLVYSSATVKKTKPAAFADFVKGE